MIYESTDGKPQRNLVHLVQCCHPTNREIRYLYSERLAGQHPKSDHVLLTRQAISQIWGYPCVALTIESACR